VQGASDPYVVWKRDETRGRYVEAARDIPAHAILFTEEPIAASSTLGRIDKTHGLRRYFPAGAYVGDGDDEGDVAENTYQNVIAMMRCRGWTDANVGSAFALAPAEVMGDEQGVPVTPLARAVRSNNFHMQCVFTGFEYGMAMVHKASSINHTCSGSNAFYQFGDAGRMYVVAGRDIRAGEEVTFRYMNQKTCDIACTHMRQVMLAPILGRACICAKCAASPCDAGCTGAATADSARENALGFAFAREMPEFSRSLQDTARDGVDMLGKACEFWAHHKEEFHGCPVHFGAFAARIVGELVCTPLCDAASPELTATLEGIAEAFGRCGRDYANPELSGGLFAALAIGSKHYSGDADADGHGRGTLDAAERERLFLNCIAWIRHVRVHWSWIGRDATEFAAGASLLWVYFAKHLELVQAEDHLQKLVMRGVPTAPP
jgi:hypothetical protein